MKLCKRVFMVVLFIVLLICLGFTHATHIYLSEQTYDIWENYDPAFYYDLQNDAMVEKFYLLGTILPDLFALETDELVSSAFDLKSGIEISSEESSTLLKILYYGYFTMIPLLDELDMSDILDIASDLDIDSYTSVLDFQKTFDVVRV